MTEQEQEIDVDIDKLLAENRQMNERIEKLRKHIDALAKKQEQFLAAADEVERYKVANTQLNAAYEAFIFETGEAQRLTDGTIEVLRRDKETAEKSVAEWKNSCESVQQTLKKAQFEAQQLRKKLEKIGGKYLRLITNEDDRNKEKAALEAELNGLITSLSEAPEMPDQKEIMRRLQSSRREKKIMFGVTFTGIFVILAIVTWVIYMTHF